MKKLSPALILVVGLSACVVGEPMEHEVDETIETALAGGFGRAAIARVVLEPTGRDAAPDARAVMILVERGDGLLSAVRASGLVADEEHRVIVHEVGDCGGKGKNAGGNVAEFNSLMAYRNGRAWDISRGHENPALSLGAGKNSIAGLSIIIHGPSDDIGTGGGDGSGGGGDGSGGGGTGGSGTGGGGGGTGGSGTGGSGSGTGSGAGGGSGARLACGVVEVL